MTRKLHPSARTNPRLRREIQQSGESDRALASRLGVNPKTIAKWKRRRTTSDARMGPKKPVSTVLSAAEEALIVVFRKRTRFSLDACLARLNAAAIPHLSRSALSRCLKRYKITLVPKGQGQKVPNVEAGADPGELFVEIHALPDEKSYLYFAISNLATIVFAKRTVHVSEFSAVDFLKALIKHAPIIFSIETNNHEAFADPESPWGPNYPSRTHPFSKVCEENNIIHIVAKTTNPAPKKVSKGWRGYGARRSSAD
jgi:transposase